METTYDPPNDQFIFALLCPYVGCGAPCGDVPDDSPELHLCAACGRPFELVRLPAGEGIGASGTWVARRPHLAFCTRSGRRLIEPSLLDWAGAGGGSGRAGSIPDRRALLFGAPTRDVEWDLSLTWSEGRWGEKDRERPQEMITSLSVFRGVLVAVGASGLVGFFHPGDGAPLLEHPLAWPGADLDDDDPARAVRLPPALRGTSMCLVTDRAALFRDIGPSLFPARGSGAVSTVAPQALLPRGLFTNVAPTSGAQWIGPPLQAGQGAPCFVLVEGVVHRGRAPDPAHVRVFGLDGLERARIEAPGIVRPPVYDEATGVLVWVSQLGHVHAVKLDDALRGVPPVTSLPLDMLELQAGERPHLVLAPNNAGAAELWLADDKEGAVRVWRTALAKALDPNADWTWETLLEHEDVGHLRGIAVGIGSRARENLASQWFVVSSEKATAAYSRAAKNAGSEAVLPREPVAPPVLTSVGYLTQDRAGLWLRGFPPWSFHEGNPERKVLVPARPQSASMTRAGFYDRTLAVLGRQVFFAHAGMVCGARLVSRRHAATAEKT